ncbi:hypothetical protein IEQ34_002175 [Dendrobium chrysotoxum]|uniref:Uncharacterized protein n=1 Tax=Dendrobium chrysotoxum TaxID=161865 RepID=A0AAV7HLJ9_DENCH|nr:hypothetical protein IEQ34_002175 [Dendrobium chrysotoxum]
MSALDFLEFVLDRFDVVEEFVQVGSACCGGAADCSGARARHLDAAAWRSWVLNPGPREKVIHLELFESVIPKPD